MRKCFPSIDPIQFGKFHFLLNASALFRKIDAIQCQIYLILIAQSIPLSHDIDSTIYQHKKIKNKQNKTSSKKMLLALECDPPLPTISPFRSYRFLCSGSSKISCIAFISWNFSVLACVQLASCDFILSGWDSNTRRRYLPFTRRRTEIVEQKIWKMNAHLNVDLLTRFFWCIAVNTICIIYILSFEIFFTQWQNIHFKFK